MRETTQEVQLKDYKIRKGSFLVPFLLAVYCDEDVYNEAHAFNPWKWMDPRIRKNEIGELAKASRYFEAEQGSVQEQNMPVCK
ncbi:unnamed protein product [Rhodiola kirilowii]